MGLIRRVLSRCSHSAHKTAETSSTPSMTPRATPTVVVEWESQWPEAEFADGEVDGWLVADNGSDGEGEPEARLWVKFPAILNRITVPILCEKVSDELLHRSLPSHTKTLLGAAQFERIWNPSCRPWTMHKSVSTQPKLIFLEGNQSRGTHTCVKSSTVICAYLRARVAPIPIRTCATIDRAESAVAVCFQYMIL